MKGFCFLFLSIIFIAFYGCSGNIPLSDRINLDKSAYDNSIISISTLRSLEQLQIRCPRVSHPFIDEALEQVLIRLSVNSDKTKIMALDCQVPFSLVAADGTILISKGMLEIIPSEASLAFIIAHELAHYSLGHLIDRQEKEAFRISEEIEADRQALKWIITANYNPWAALQVLSDPDLIAHSANIESTTHPIPQERRRDLEALLVQSQWSPPGTVSSRSFLRLKQILS